jgi:hypothetical protein
MPTKTDLPPVNLKPKLVELSADRRMTLNIVTCPKCGYGKTQAECMGEKDEDGAHYAQLQCPDCFFEWYVQAPPGKAIKVNQHWVNKVEGAS